MLPNKFSSNWLERDPSAWRERKVFNRRNGATYTIREVMHNGKVLLEKHWTLYNADVATLRRDFEIA